MTYRLRGIVMLLMFACAPIARGNLTAFWRHNPISAQAIIDDPALALMQSWSVMVSNTESLFAWAGLRAILPPGLTFYVHPQSTGFPATQAQQAAHPALQFTTYVTSPRYPDGLLSYIGGFPDSSVPSSLGGPNSLTPGTLSVTWGDFDVNLARPGSYEIARVTYPNGLHPAIHPASMAFYLWPDQMVHIPVTIPEPDAVALLSTGFPLLLRRLRRR